MDCLCQVEDVNVTASLILSISGQQERKLLWIEVRDILLVSLFSQCIKSRR